MNDKLKVVCLTNDNYLWAVRPFAYLMCVYWSTQQPIVMGGFSYPRFRMTPNVEYVQIATQNYPANKWSNGLIKLLNAIEDDHVVFVLEDYWLSRTVDLRGVDMCHKYIKDRDNVLRIDLTDDRQYAGGMIDVESWGCYDIVETLHGTPYQFSTQAGIWNRQLLLSLLKDGRTAWETEIDTQPPADMRVLGTRQCPIRYANSMLRGKLQLSEIKKIPQPHRSKIRGWLPQHIRDEAEE